MPTLIITDDGDKGISGVTGTEDGGGDGNRDGEHLQKIVAAGM
jgi:hypothetical protein